MGGQSAREAYAEFGGLLAQALDGFLQDFSPEVLCIGGQITASAALFIEPLQTACCVRGVRLCLTENTSLRAMLGLL